MKSTEEHITDVCNEIRDMLIEKNRSYGDSAVNPVRVFAKGMTVEQMINVRIDDKLSRLMRGEQNVYSNTEDTEKDLMGYLILKRVASRRLLEEAQANNGVAPGAQAMNRTVTDQDIVTGAARPHGVNRFDGEAPNDDLQCVAVNQDNVRCRRAQDHEGPHRAGEGYNMVEWKRRAVEPNDS